MTATTKTSIYKWAVASKILGIIATILATVFVNRALGVDKKGEYAYIINIVNILYVAFSLGIGTIHSTYKKRKVQESADSLYTILLIQTLIILSFSVFVRFVWNSDVFWILLLTAGCVLKSNLLTIAAIEDVKTRDKSTVIYHFVYLALTVILYVFFHENVKIALAIYLIDTIISSLGTIVIYKFRPINIFKKINSNNVKTFLKLSIPTTLMQIMIVLNYNLDIVMLKNIKGTYDVGLYSVAINFGNMIWLIPDAFKDVILNTSSRKDDKNEIIKLIKINLIISTVAYAMFILFGYYFIYIFYGADFTASYIPTILLLVGSLAMIIYKLIHPLYISNGQQSLILKTLTISVIINIIFNLILIPSLGIYGAIISSVVSYSVCGIVFLIIFVKEYKIRKKDLLITKKDLIAIKKYLKHTNRKNV